MVISQKELSTELDKLSNDIDRISPVIQGFYKKKLEMNKRPDGRYIQTLHLLTQIASQGESILDLGAMPGHLSVLMQKAGYAVKGADIEPDRMEKFWMKYDIEVRQCDLEVGKIPYSDKKFDVVLFTETIEHLYSDPIKVLDEINRILKPGGRVVLSTNNVNIITKIDYALEVPFQCPVKAHKKLKTQGSRGHVRLYQRSELVRLLEYCGFIVIKEDYVGKPMLTTKQKMLTWPIPERKLRHSIILVGKKV